MNIKAARRKYKYILTKAPRDLSSGCTDSKKKEKIDKKGTPTCVPPQLDLHNYSSEPKERLPRPTICILGPDSTPLGLLS